MYVSNTLEQFDDISELKKLWFFAGLNCAKKKNQNEHKRKYKKRTAETVERE